MHLAVVARKRDVSEHSTAPAILPRSRPPTFEPLVPVRWTQGKCQCRPDGRPLDIRIGASAEPGKVVVVVNDHARRVVRRDPEEADEDAPLARAYVLQQARAEAVLRAVAC